MSNHVVSTFFDVRNLLRCLWCRLHTIRASCAHFEFSRFYRLYENPMPSPSSLLDDKFSSITSSSWNLSLSCSSFSCSEVWKLCLVNLRTSRVWCRSSSRSRSLLCRKITVSCCMDSVNERCLCFSFDAFFLLEKINFSLSPWHFLSNFSISSPLSMLL